MILVFGVEGEGRKVVVLDVSKAYEVVVEDEAVTFYFPYSTVKINVKVENVVKLADRIASFMKSNTVTTFDFLLKMAGGDGGGEEVQGRLRGVREEDEGEDKEENYRVTRPSEGDDSARRD